MVKSFFSTVFLLVTFCLNAQDSSCTYNAIKLQRYKSKSHTIVLGEKIKVECNVPYKRVKGELTAVTDSTITIDSTDVILIRSIDLLTFGSSEKNAAPILLFGAGAFFGAVAALSYVAMLDNVNSLTEAVFLLGSLTSGILSAAFITAGIATSLSRGYPTDKWDLVPVYVTKTKK
jgi:hypothetical protein